MTTCLRYSLQAICMVLCFATSSAQTVVSSNLLLVDPGSGHMVKLQVPTLTGPLTYNLPNSNGTLLITSGSGVSQGWLLGGNDLSAAGPTENRIGSTTAQDVVFVAAGDGRMQLSSGSSNVSLLDGTSLTFQEAGVTPNVSSFAAGVQASDINYTLPTTQPAVNQVLAATAVSGTGPYAVTLGWQSSAGWLLGGNTGVTASNNIIGIAEVNTNPLRFFTNNTEKMQIDQNGLAGIGTAPVSSYRLSVSGNIRLTNTTTSSIVANKELVLEEQGDQYGTSRLLLQHRTGSNGALFETIPSSPGIDLVDFGFKPGAGVQSNIRLEARSGTLRNSGNTVGEFEFFFGTTTTPTYSFSTGIAASSFETGNVGIGMRNPGHKFTVGTSSQEFRVNGTGDLTRINNVGYTWPTTNATSNGFVLTSTTGGTLTWAAPSPAGGRALITGDGVAAAFVLNNAAITTTSVITVTLEDGTDANFYNYRITARAAGQFTLTLSAVMANAATKYVNYMVSNP